MRFNLSDQNVSILTNMLNDSYSLHTKLDYLISLKYKLMKNYKEIYIPNENVWLEFHTKYTVVLI